MSNDHWFWFASNNQEDYAIGPFADRDEAIATAISDELGLDDDNGSQHFWIAEGHQPPLRLADWFDSDRFLETCNDALWDSDRVSYEHDDGDIFSCTRDQGADLIARLKAACDEWQAAHNLTFNVRTFSAMRNMESISLTKDQIDAMSQPQKQEARNG